MGDGENDADVSSEPLRIRNHDIFEHVHVGGMINEQIIMEKLD